MGVVYRHSRLSKTYLSTLKSSGTLLLTISVLDYLPNPLSVP